VLLEDICFDEAVLLNIVFIAALLIGQSKTGQAQPFDVLIVNFESPTIDP
jgi:hypothetical protein